MYICICNAITENEIRQAISLGVNSVEQLKEVLGVACACKACEPYLKNILLEIDQLSA